MVHYIDNNENAIIILHEIYGVNSFIKSICQQLFNEGNDIFCPELLGKSVVFPYNREQEAYTFFTKNVGFDAYREVQTLVAELKLRYRKVILMGFSVGATIAWRKSPLNRSKY